MKTKNKLLISIVFSMTLLGCNTKEVSKESTEVEVLKRYDEICFNAKLVFEENEYIKDDIDTYSFKDNQIFKGSEDLQSQLLESGKNPGLGINTLHEQGITGKGVNVAIIDQDIVLDHPEYAGKIVKVFDIIDKDDDNIFPPSMHAAAISSILAGETVGVAPDAKIYFASLPQGETNGAVFAECLNWIIEENKILSDKDKIRVVSVSFSPQNSNEDKDKYDLWEAAKYEAELEGILVLDCKDDRFSPMFCDPLDLDDISKCKPGWRDLISSQVAISRPRIGVQVSNRTLAHVSLNPLINSTNKYSYDYVYYGEGGMSWGIPYVAGVLALGWQVNPELSGNEMVSLLISNGTIISGSNMIDPVKFIESVKKTVK